MRRVAGVLACALAWGAPYARAASEEFATSTLHEVVHVPPSPLPLFGPRYALVTLELSLALTNPTSAFLLSVCRALVERHRDAVRLLVRVTGIGPPGATLMAEAAMEAERQGRLFEFLERLSSDRVRLLSLSELLDVGEEAGLNGAELEAALDKRWHREAVAKNGAVASRPGHSAPELLVNGVRIGLFSSAELLERFVLQASVEAVRLRDRGIPLSRLYEALTAAKDPARPLPTVRERLRRR